MLAVVASRADTASMRIREQLLELADWTVHEDAHRPAGAGGGTYHRGDGIELRTFDGLHIDLENAAEAFGDPDLLVFVSRHSGETGPLLTAHHTGNFGPAEFGGEPGTLARAAPNALDRVLAALREHAPVGYDIGLECTHHGPTDLSVPSLFVEVGSDESQWHDPEAAAAVARAVLALRGVDPDTDRTVVGFGGGHYAPRFGRILRETDWTAGHIAADWGLEAMGDPDPGLLDQAFEKSDATRAVIDGDYPEVAATIEGIGYRVVSETWIRETDGVDLELVDRLETAIGPIEEGLRFGAPAREADGFELRRPDPDLLAEAHGVDPEATLGAAETYAVGFDTAENGNRLTGPVATAGADTYDALIDELAEVLRRDNERVDRTADAVIVHDRRFEPDRARELGVPEGPAFGRLAGGDPVEIDGDRVDPEEVHTDRRRRYPI